MRGFARVLLALSLTAGGADCASRASGSSALGHSRVDPRFISLVEIQRSGEATAYDVVQSLRPLWFHKRGPQSFVLDGDVLVYAGDAELGDRNALHEIAASTVASMRFLDATDASYRYGMNHPHGVIVVSTVFPPGR